MDHARGSFETNGEDLAISGMETLGLLRLERHASSSFLLLLACV